MTKYDTQGAFEKLREDPFLPPAPTSRKSRKGWVIAGAVVGMLGLAAGTGAIAAQSNSRPEPSTPVAVVEPVETETTIVEAASQSVPLVTDAVDHLDGALAAFENYDVDGAADHTEAAADDYASVSAIWFGVDDHLSDLNNRIADEMYASADDLRAMRIGSATDHMNRATSLIEEATTYTDTLG